MDRYPFGEGDQWSYQESNEVVGGVRQTRTRPSERESDAQVLVTPHKMVEAFSVFGVGQNGGNAQTIPQEIAMRDPISESSAPYYTNRSGAIDQNSPWWVWPIGAIPEEITLEGTVEPGDRAKPNDDGKAEQDDSGELLCVSDTVEGRASFVYSPMAATGKVAVRAPVGGLAAGATDDLEIFNQAGQSNADTLRIENVWSTRVGDNPQRILFVARVRGIGADDTYKPTSAECNEGAP